MPEGIFISRVFTSNAQLPIENALMIATQGRNLLAIRRTDRSGITDPIAVPTPPESESLSPGSAKPYAVIDVMVDHPEYLRIVSRNIQLFPNVTTYQNFELVPISLMPEQWNETERFDTPAQNL